MKHCTTHCRACDSHFTSTRAFDLHRDGSHQDGTRHCVEPEDLEGLERVPGPATCDLQRPRTDVHIRLWAVLGYREVGERLRGRQAQEPERREAA